MVVLNMSEILRVGHQALFASYFIVLSFCMCTGSVQEESEIFGDIAGVHKHPSNGGAHRLIFPNESAVSRVYQSKRDLIYSIGETRFRLESACYVPLLRLTRRLSYRQELESRPLVRGRGHESCPLDVPCSRLNAECLTCKFKYSCVYGEEVAVMYVGRTAAPAAEDTSDVRQSQNLKLRRTYPDSERLKIRGMYADPENIMDRTRPFERKVMCRYCYQKPSSEHTCDHNSSSPVNSAPRQRYIATCNVRPDILCLGRKQFHKNLVCNWTRGYSSWTALLLSIVLGGFGADHFYLGMWQEGIGKLFSFGGLGVSTLVDVVLVAAGYLGPADGSLYIS